MKRIGFVIAPSNGGWLGGANYLRNLLWAIHAIPQPGFEVLLFMGHHTAADAIGPLPPFRIVRSSLLDRKSPAWILRKLVQRLCGTDAMLSRLFVRHGVSLYSHGSGFAGDGPVKTLGWIPDFQHRHLPHFFDAAEFNLREKAGEELLCNCSRVVVSSETARQDALRFHPAHAAKVAVLHFAVPQPEAARIAKREALEERYDFKGDYLYLPNQLWIHKNHAIVIDALAALGDAAPLCLLTGATEDFRHPGYFASLMEKVRAAGLEARFRMLGVVPYGDVIALMAHARLVINPSLFEGWSTTVEEAKAMGKPLLLSDIPVHREQAPSGSAFFPPDDASALAEALQVAWASATPAANSAQRAAEAFRRFGLDYQAIVSPLL
ncbi:MAG TPA: glycosyltransferase family 1 protein [Rhodocyclaceae bacterium]